MATRATITIKVETRERLKTFYKTLKVYTADEALTQLMNYHSRIEGRVKRAKTVDYKE